MSPFLPSASVQPHQPRRTWFGRLTGSNMFAWLLSAVIHATVFVALYLAVFREEFARKQVIIPEARLTPTVEAIPEQTSPPLQLLSDPIRQTTIETAAPKLDVHPLAAATLVEPGTFAVPTISGTGTADSLGSVVMVSSGAGGPVSSFFGQAGSAYRIVYVVDMSGSLTLYMDEIMSQLRQSVRVLVPTQQFNVVVTSEGQVHEYSHERLVWANARHKQGVSRFLDTITGKLRASEIQAMERAFACDPELIYFLTDGDYQDVETALRDGTKTALETRLQELNDDRSARITVIGFDCAPRPRIILERIARDHGGRFREVIVEE